MQAARALSSLLFFLSFALSACSSTSAAPRASEAEIAERIARGRALLDSGNPLEAEAQFRDAAAADQGSLRTRMWVLRAWMDQGRSNETLDALDELDQAGEKGIEMTYLYGMAFARRAEGYLAQGITDSSVQMNFLDAADYLAQAVEADGARYHDAFLPLANSAWYVQEIDTARWAADRAVETHPGSPDVWLTRGRIAMAQFAAAEAEQAGSPAAETLWRDAADSFTQAVGRSSTPEGAATPAKLADASTQLGHAMVWRKKGPEATAAYAQAIAAAPESFEYARVVELLRNVPSAPEDERPHGFRAALESAHTSRAALAPSATLLWWLGWARFVDADWEGSESAFQEVLALAPEYSNSWFYIGLARQYRKDSAGALQAMHAGWDADPATMIATAASAGGALRAFENLLGWCATQEPARNLDAAFLARMLAEAMPDEARHWNNVGLFLRDEGERLEIDAYKNETAKPDPALLADLYGRSYEAYQRALELDPQDPQLLNDTALMLEYHIGGKVSEVEAMFRRALELVEERLAQEISEEDRARFEVTREDIGFNLKTLLEPEVAPEAGANTAASAPAAASQPE